MKAILPFRPIVRHFFTNLWHLRLFLLAIFLLICISSAVFYASERDYILPNKSLSARLKEMFFITMSDVIPVKVAEYSAKTDLGKCMTIINSFCGFLLLGLLIWVIKQSMSGQRLKKSKLLVIPTKEDL